MLIELLTFDPGLQAGSPAAYAEEVTRLVLEAWKRGADLTVLPEFTWMGLETWVDPSLSATQRYEAISELFWATLLPTLRRSLANPAKAVVLGTVPWHCPSTGRLYNRAPILAADRLFHQDKLHLTPWEGTFSAGEHLNLWTFKDMRIAVVICLDIEIPEISVSLRRQGVDLIVCPSATETILGVERVDRCASARAVELGCHVVVTHLTGKAESELIDENIGRLAHYLPSQHAFRHAARWQETEIFDQGVHHLRLEVEPQRLERMRRMTVETNPSHLGKEMAGQFSLCQIESLISEVQ